MGNSSSAPASTDDIEKFRQSVFFTGHEIQKLLDRFTKLGGSLEKSIPLSSLINIDELKYNPFRFRIARVFGEIVHLEEPHSPTGDEPKTPTGAAISPLNKVSREQLLLSSQEIGRLSITFDSFLKMLSSFSERADLNTKTRLAFAIYDFDQDGQLSLLDIECMISVALGKANLHPTQYRQIAHEIMNEVDIDGNGTLTELEFSRILTRVHDFQDRLTFEVQFS